MTPFVSFVFPAHAGGLPLLTRSVAALRAQTAERGSFEAVVAIDAPANNINNLVLRAEQALAPFRADLRIRVVASPRTPGREGMPHRNHARNAGCRAATGDYLWVLDCDIIPDPNAVTHLRAVTCGRTLPVVASPCLAEPKCSPQVWLTWPMLAVVEDFRRLPRRFSLQSCSSSGHGDKYRRGPPCSERFPKLIEGEPAFPRRIWEVLGFDERYFGYGGNKVSLSRACTLLDSQEGLCSVELLTSLRFIHQPHARDPLRTNDEHRKRNWKIFHEHVAEMRNNAPWWREAVEALR